MADWVIVVDDNETNLKMAGHILSRAHMRVTAMKSGEALIGVEGDEVCLRDGEDVETVCILSKLSSAKEHIEVTVDMDELDLTSAEAKATYNEIRNWVQEHYGMHVTNLNIAQVKQKHGIIERDNYNKPKSPDSKQPQCPDEKVKAIEDAMRHFQMIK